jgi:hypothetical protein
MRNLKEVLHKINVINYEILVTNILLFLTG